MAASPWTQADPPLSRWNQQRNTSSAFDNGNWTPQRQHALSFEGAGRFWKPTEPKEPWSSRFLKRKPDRSRALSSPRPQDELPSPVSNVGEWLNSQSLSELSDPSQHDDSPTHPENPSPDAQAGSHESRGSMSQHGSDSVSVHTVSSRTSLANMTSLTRFQSLSEQIAEDERKARAKQHLKRIMEAEEARIAQLDPASDEKETESNPGYLSNHPFPNGLRLTFEPQNESWDINEFMIGAKPTANDSPPDYDASNESHQASINLGQIFEKSTESSSVHTITVTDEKIQTEPFPSISSIPHIQELEVHETPKEDGNEQRKPLPQIPQTQELGAPRLSGKRKDVRVSAPSNPIEMHTPDISPKSHVETEKEARSMSEPGTKASSPSELHSTASSRPQSKVSHKSTSSVSSNQTPLELHSTVSSRPQSKVSHKSNSSISSTQTPPQDTTSFSPLPDTLFQDLNRLKMSSSIRQGAPGRPSKPPEVRTQSAPTGPPHSARTSSSAPSPALVFPTYSPPHLHPNSSGPVYKEVLTPPIPTNIIELSTSPSVIHRPKGPQVDEKYRRNRQHSDFAAYNTLPHEPFPLLLPEPRFEAPPSEEDLQHLSRAGTPRLSMITPHPPPKNPPRPISIEPEIDPRTGFPYRS